MVHLVNFGLIFNFALRYAKILDEQAKGVRNFMRKESQLQDKRLIAEKFRFRKCHVTDRPLFTTVTRVAVFTFAFAFFFFCEAHAAEDEVVLLPSRLANTSGSMAVGDATKMVEEWMSATGVTPRTSSSPQSLPYMTNRNKRIFEFEGMRPRIICQVSMITDIELEPGERVTNFSISDGQNWSISATWSGAVDNITTHVLLRTFFPGLKSNLTILTDRRIYEMELVSGIDVHHMAYVGFRYHATREKESESEQIPPGKYRDLLVHYGIIDSREPEAPKEVRRVDGAELNFRYVIKSLVKKKPLWTPRSVYDADGKTYFVMPRRKIKEQPSLYIMNKGERVLINVIVVKEDLYMVEHVFEEAIMKFGNEEVSIRRVRSSD